MLPVDHTGKAAPGSSGCGIISIGNTRSMRACTVQVRPTSVCFEFCIPSSFLV
nr:MAG TPA: hypothetical protein [Caudoviricetes sp.]